MPDTDHVHVTVDDAVGRLVMDRPDRYNAMDPPMARAIASGLDRLAGADDVRCIVLTGTGAAYNTGADLSTLSGDASDRDAIDDIVRPLHRSVRTLARAPKPVVAGVNGVVAGGGLGLAVAPDIVVLSENARFEYAYPSIGLSGDGGITWLLSRLIGLRRTQRFVLLDEPIGPDQALESGLVTEVVEPDALDDRVSTLAKRLATGPTKAYARIRRLLVEGTDRSLSRHLDREREYLTGLTRTADYATGIDAFGDENDPEFVGR